MLRRQVHPQESRGRDPFQNIFANIPVRSCHAIPGADRQLRAPRAYAFLGTGMITLAFIALCVKRSGAEFLYALFIHGALENAGRRRGR